MTLPLMFGQPPNDNTLYFGDCLDWMREWASSSVDLIYLDPPFNSKQNYNLLYSDTPSDAQGKAFEDTWVWDDGAESRYERFDGLAGPLAETIRGLMRCLGRSGMLAYLSYMAERLEQCHRLLKPTGSIYLHCDPTASHPLKLLLDAIFGVGNFRNEIIWSYKRWTATKKQLPRLHDVIFNYGRSADAVFNPVLVPNTDPNPSQYVSAKDETGKTVVKKDGHGNPIKRETSRFLTVGDVWDLPIISPNGKERLGYPTQKPLKLLKQIILSGSKPGDLVLDPFCGCGTTIEAAEQLGRRWAGIDISLHAVNVIRKIRMPDTPIEVDGIPTDMHSARYHARQRPFRFEQWAVECVPGFVANTKQRGDGGVDGWGRLAVRPEGGLTRTAVAQVKGGKWKVDSLKAFCTVTRQRKAAVGCYITLDQLTADSARQIRSQEGSIKVAGNRYPRMSLWSIEQFFGGEKNGPMDLPMLVNVRTGKPIDQGVLF